MVRTCFQVCFGSLQEHTTGCELELHQSLQEHNNGYLQLKIHGKYLLLDIIKYNCMLSKRQLRWDGSYKIPKLL